MITPGDYFQPSVNLNKALNPMNPSQDSKISIETDAEAKARSGWGIDDLVVHFGLSRDQAKRVVFGKSKEGKAS